MICNISTTVYNEIKKELNSVNRIFKLLDDTVLTYDKLVHFDSYNDLEKQKYLERVEPEKHYHFKYFSYGCEIVYKNKKYIVRTYGFNPHTHTLFKNRNDYFDSLPYENFNDVRIKFTEQCKQLLITINNTLNTDIQEDLWLAQDL